VLTIGSFDLRRWGASSGMAAAGAPLRRPGLLCDGDLNRVGGIEKKGALTLT
jgi:hypothetical protein